MEATVLPQLLVSSESHLASSKQSSIILCQFSPVDALQQQWQVKSSIDFDGVF